MTRQIDADPSEYREKDHRGRWRSKDRKAWTFPLVVCVIMLVFAVVGYGYTMPGLFIATVLFAVLLGVCLVFRFPGWFDRD